MHLIAECSSSWVRPKSSSIRLENSERDNNTCFNWISIHWICSIKHLLILLRTYVTQIREQKVKASFKDFVWNAIFCTSSSSLSVYFLITFQAVKLKEMCKNILLLKEKKRQKQVVFLLTNIKIERLQSCSNYQTTSSWQHNKQDFIQQ